MRASEPLGKFLWKIGEGMITLKEMGTGSFTEREGASLCEEVNMLLLMIMERKYARYLNVFSKMLHTNSAGQACCSCSCCVPFFFFQSSATRLFLVDASPLSMPFAILIQIRILMSFV